MTYTKLNNILENMTEEQFDKYGQILAKVHKKLLKTDKDAADALELAFQAMTLYCNK